ncbi:hypothetical protein [Granulicella sp. S190]|uniref:hypothetical protein n=1 Tax=Granulicella sp. S190 TaxID=1747226 RepID=UPI001C206724|nr:hypothetical protein [Granulicella sp. S190]
MDGPLLIFDKSALQLLGVDESAWLDNFFQSVITPLFYVETLADLEKKMGKDRTAEQEVKLIAARMPEQQATPSVHHSTLIASELAGFFRLDTDRAKRVLPQGQPVMLGDSKGIIYRDAPEEEALRRWQEGQFIELERDIAKQWRAALAETDNGVLYESFKRVYERNPKPKDLPSLKAFVDATLARAPDDWFLGFVLELVGASDEEKASVRQRWDAEGKPPIQNFLPYFVHVFTVDLFFYLGIAADLISRNRASHRADIAYLYYLPFCSIFTSADKLHKGIAPLFLKDHQIFLPGDELKAEMKKLNNHYSSLPQEVLDRGMMNFAKFPPEDTGFLTTRLWDRFDPEWRELATNPPKLDADMQAALLELVNRFKNESTPLHPETYIPLKEVGQLTIEKRVSTTRGKWHRFSPEVEATSKPRRVETTESSENP